VGFVAAGDDETLAALYRGATALVFPSLYEGFGIPALEAMASGTPVIASETTGLGEMVGNAALRVDPLDTEAIAAAMDRLADGASLRDELRRRGLERSGRYTWDRTAARIAEVIDAALEDD
jgi:glycosyltransferase involved in cell wall biosynthesis